MQHCCCVAMGSTAHQTHESLNPHSPTAKTLTQVLTTLQFLPVASLLFSYMQNRVNTAYPRHLLPLMSMIPAPDRHTTVNDFLERIAEHLSDLEEELRDEQRSQKKSGAKYDIRPRSSRRYDTKADARTKILDVHQV